MKPTFVAMLDLEKIFMNRDQFPGLPENLGSTRDPKFMHEVELAVMKRGPVGANAERITQVIEEFIDMEKYEEFVSELKPLIEDPASI